MLSVSLVNIIIAVCRGNNAEQQRNNEAELFQKIIKRI